MNDTSDLVHRELTETELAEVSGGVVVATAGSTVILAMHKAGAGSSSYGPGYNS